MQMDCNSLYCQYTSTPHFTSQQNRPPSEEQMSESGPGSPVKLFKPSFTIDSILGRQESDDKNKQDVDIVSVEINKNEQSVDTTRTLQTKQPPRLDTPHTLLQHDAGTWIRNLPTSVPSATSTSLQEPDVYMWRHGKVQPSGLTAVK